MDVARASGTDLASSLRQNAFLTLEVRPAGGPGSARDGGTRGGPGRWDTGEPGTGGHDGPRDGGTRGTFSWGGYPLRGWVHLCKIQPKKGPLVPRRGGEPLGTFFRGGVMGYPPRKGTFSQRVMMG